jgi:hypothetical protein
MLTRVQYLHLLCKTFKLQDVGIIQSSAAFLNVQQRLQDLKMTHFGCSGLSMNSNVQMRKPLRECTGVLCAL